MVRVVVLVQCRVARTFVFLFKFFELSRRKRLE